MPGTEVKVSDSRESSSVTQPALWSLTKKTIANKVYVTEEEMLWVLWERVILGTLKGDVLQQHHRGSPCTTELHPVLQLGAV